MRRKGIFAGMALFFFCIVSSCPCWSETSELGRLLEEGFEAYYTSNNSEAIGKWKKGIELARKSGDKQTIGSLLDIIGQAYSNLGQYEKALSYYEQAHAIKKEIGDRWGERDALHNIGLMYDVFCQYEKALSYYGQALAIDKEIGNRMGERAALNNIGLMYSILGQDEKALSYHKQAIAISKKIGYRMGEGQGHTNIGVVYWNLGQYEKALSYYGQALAIDKEIGNRRGEGIDLTNIGVVYSNLGQYEKARQTFQEGLDICLEVGAPQSLWRAQRGLGETEAKLEKHNKAVVHYEQALDTIEAMREGLTEKEVKTSFMKGKLFVYDELIELLQGLYKKNPSKGYGKKSLEIFERKQGRIFLEEMGKSAARNFAGIPETVLAQESNLIDQLTKFQSDLANERSKTRKKMDRERIRDLEEKIRTLKEDQQALEEEIKTNYPDYYTIKYPKPATLTELQGKVLKPGEVILVYGVMEKSTCLWVIGKENQFGFYPIDIDEKTLVQKVNYFRKGPEAVLEAIKRKYPKSRIRRIARQTMPKLHESGTELYDLLIPEKARSLINKAKTLYIVPTGPLYSLPFEALLIPGTKDQRFLIEGHSIAYLSSASLLKTLRDAAARRKEKPLYPLLAFANPVYKKTGAPEKPPSTLKGMRTRAYLDIMGGSFDELPDTEDEAREIKTILQAPDKSHPLQLREAASRSRVFNFNKEKKLDDYQYVIFSCHGILPGEVDRVNQPALVLSLPDPETKKEDFLTMGDVFGLKLNADLVTLSACNTGRGKAIKGEGVMGLTRSFMYAGTPAVSVTLWSVESGSAKIISTGMYRALKQGGTRAEALRSVKLRMISGKEGELFKHPFFWAPVVIFGDAS